MPTPAPSPSQFQWATDGYQAKDRTDKLEFNT